MASLAGTAVTGLFIWTLVFQWKQVLDAMSHISILLFVAITIVQFALYPLRTWAWERCIRAAGARTPSDALHLSSAASALASALGPMHLAPIARAGVLELNPQKAAPSIGQMIAADVVLAILQALAAGIFILVVAAKLIPWPVELAVLALVGALAIATFLNRGKLAQYRWFHILQVMRSPLSFVALGAFSVSSLIVQTFRWWSIIRAVGFSHFTPLQSLITFVVTTATGSPLPIGPGLYKSHLAHTHSSRLAAAVSAGLVTTISATLAACIYVLLAMAIFNRPAAVKLWRFMPSVPGWLWRRIWSRRWPLRKKDISLDE